MSAVRASSLRYAILDLEFTGLSPLEGDGVIEIAGLLLDGGVIVAEFDSLVNPGIPVPAETIELTGIDPLAVAAAPPFAQIAPQLLAFLGDAPLVTHNLAYDIAALQWEMARAGLSVLRHDGIDTLDLARRVFPGERNNLRSLRERLSVEAAPTHRAMDDARVTAEVFTRLVAMLEARGEVARYRDLRPAQCAGLALVPPGSDVAEREAVHAVLVHAATQRRMLRILYGSPGKPPVERIVEPFCLIGPYLRAYCHTKVHELNFYVSRVKAATETGDAVTRMPEPPRGPAVFSPAFKHVGKRG